jgi:type IV secretion system protein VirB3
MADQGLLSRLRDPIFKGCTRPAMFLGVPAVPLACAVGFITLLSVYTSILVAISLAPIIFLMRMVTANDDQQFRLLYLKALLRLKEWWGGNGRFWKASSYSPMQFQRRK